MTSVGARALRGGSVTLIANGVRYAMTLATTSFVARFVGPADYGIVGMALTVMSLAWVLNDMGLGMATVQCERIDRAQLDTMFWLSAASGVIACLAVFAAAGPLAALFDDARVADVLRVLSFAFVVGAGASTQHLAIIRRELRFVALARVETLATFASSAVTVTCAALGAGYWALVAQVLVQAAATSVGAWIICDFRPRLRCSPREVGALLRTSGDVAGSNLLNYVVRNLDNVLIGRVWGATELGFYSRAYSLLLAPLNQISVPVAKVAIPALSRLRGDEYRRAYLRIFEKTALLTTPLAALLVACPGWCVDVLLGPAWSPVASIFQVLGVAGLLQPLTTAIGWLFVSQGRTREMLKLGLVSAAIATASFVVGLPWRGIGVATAYVVCDVAIRTPLVVWIAGRRGPIGVGDLCRASFPFVVLAAASIGAVTAFRVAFAHVHPLLGLIGACAMVAVAGPLALAAIRSGRAILRDTVRLLARVTRHSACLVVPVEESR